MEHPNPIPRPELDKDSGLEKTFLGSIHYNKHFSYQYQNRKKSRKENKERKIAPTEYE